MILFLRDGHRGHCPQRRVGRGVGGGIAAGRAIAVAGVIGRRGAALVEGEADGALAESAAIIPIPSRNTGRRNTKSPFFLIS